MAETLTIDPTPTAEVMSTPEGVDLTADEQDSLAVGEQIVEQQEQLLAGKYKDAEALEKAYINLQKKLGEDEQEKETPEAEAEQEEVLPEESEESTEEPSEAATLISSASEEFAESGKLTPETLAAFNSMSSQDLVEAYMKVQASLPDEAAEAASIDLTNAAVNEVKNYAGGEKVYQDVVNWAGENLNQGAIDAFDSIVGTGNVDAIKLAVNGLKAQYETANGYEGRMVTGKAPTATKDAFRSQAELVKAMSDKRYDNDPAYRQDVIEKLERSDNLQF
jgi:hypothetical protein